MINFLIKNPVLSHGVTAFYQTGLLVFLYIFLRWMHWDDPAVLAFIGVSIFYYGREAGQREHDLKNLYRTSPVLAAFGADYMFKWAGSNVLQWLGAVLGAALMAALLLFIFVVKH